MKAKQTKKPSVSDITENDFYAYDTVRREGKINMFDIKQAVQHAGIPEDIIEVIQENYPIYREVFGSSLSPHAIFPDETFGCITAYYDDIIELYGTPSTLHLRTGAYLIPNVRWSLMTQYGCAVISHFKTDHGDLTERELRKVSQWRVAADTHRAYDEISKEVHEYVMRKRAEG